MLGGAEASLLQQEELPAVPWLVSLPAALLSSLHTAAEPEPQLPRAQTHRQNRKGGMLAPFNFLLPSPAVGALSAHGLVAAISR